ncbi:cytochrome P450 [Paracoccus sp. TK19116]|uniref:Cytochrome P450 n=1 Tax=Paracoccus albicereus TaxID=2922394 RepID=A0ABT1MP01_9RHOB|nr:cytochrome P450 [Paracoccus albicereus]MCQ0970019.1 cytochrome P450 [Paracoccus albicereus]
MIPPKPESSEGRAGVLRFARAFRRDLLSALPARLYRAWMAEYRAPLIHSFFCNHPDLIRTILRDRPRDFPKSDRLREGLAPLLGQSVFVTNGPQWEKQRRIIDPAFEGGRLREVFDAMWDATDAAIARLPEGEGDIEPQVNHLAADIMFRTLFSIPIGNGLADRVYRAFRDHQDSQPIVNPAALLPWPRWLPRPHSRRTRASAEQIRGLITALVAVRARAISDGTAPDDLATKIMTTPDPLTGRRFTQEEVVDQVAIFFLAGHETGAAALSWTLWLLAAHPEWQERVAEEGRELPHDFAALSRLKITRACFREAMRLYPPVPMMVREATQVETFRDRQVPIGAQLVISPWHLHRHERLWHDPDTFDPNRFLDSSSVPATRDAYIPFSTGARACPGAGFAMMEGVLATARITAAFRMEPGEKVPVPQARLTVRGRDGITIRLTDRGKPS